MGACGCFSSIGIYWGLPYVAQVDEKINVQSNYIASLKKNVQNKIDENVEKIQQTQDEINVCNVDVATKSGTIADKMKDAANLEKLQKRMEKRSPWLL